MPSGGQFWARNAKKHLRIEEFALKRRGPEGFWPISDPPRMVTFRQFWPSIPWLWPCSVPRKRSKNGRFWPNVGPRARFCVPALNSSTFPYPFSRFCQIWGSRNPPQRQFWPFLTYFWGTEQGGSHGEMTPRMTPRMVQFWPIFPWLWPCSCISRPRIVNSDPISSILTHFSQFWPIFLNSDPFFSILTHFSQFWPKLHEKFG